jgi:hypothetical protein
MNAAIDKIAKRRGKLPNTDVFFKLMRAALGGFN